MPLESLHELVETLRNRIDEHGEALRQSEALTRYALIDPLLRELGWNTEDPALVMPEYRLGAGSADYALLSNGKPVMMIEAKKLGTLLNDATSQGIRYCIEGGIGYFAVTDGSRWEIYETHKPVPIDQKRIVSFDLKSMVAPKVCLQALALWRRSIEDGVVSVGQTPILANLDDPPAPLPPTAKPMPQPQSISESISLPEYTHPSDTTGWIPLPEFNPKSGDKPPSKIMFSDYSTSDLRFWKDIPVETIRWLLSKNIFNESHCPIQPVGRGRRYLVSTKPVHPDGKQFKQSTQVGRVYLEANYSAAHHIKNARAIIQHVGQDASQFKVRFSS